MAQPQHQVVLHATGAPEVMRLEPVEAQAPDPGEVWLTQAAIGVNPLDVSQRKGAVRIPLPSGLGLEGAGTVAAIGAGVGNVAVGDRVAYATGPLGAYANARRFPAERLVKLPESLSFDDAAAVLFQSLFTAFSGPRKYLAGMGC